MEISNLIPQVYFDLIGRVSPGITLLLLFVVTHNDASTVRDLVRLIGNQQTSQTTPALLTVLLFGYMIGFLLGAFGYFIAGKEWGKWPPRATPTDEDSPEYRYDFIQYFRPNVGLRLGKLSAERHLCHVLIGGLSLLMISVICRTACEHANGWLHGVWFWLIAITGLAAAILFRLHLDIRHSKEIATFYRLTSEDKDAAKRSSQSDDQEMR